MAAILTYHSAQAVLIETDTDSCQTFTIQRYQNSAKPVQNCPSCCPKDGPAAQKTLEKTVTESVTSDSNGKLITEPEKTADPISQKPESIKPFLKQTSADIKTEPADPVKVEVDPGKAKEVEES